MDATDLRMSPTAGRWVRLLGPALLLTQVTGCAARQYPMPITPAQLAGYDGAALVAYLGQADASAGVCDLDAAWPHARILDDETRRALDGAFREGRLTPRRWASCVGLLLRSAGSRAAPLLTDAVVDACDLLNDAGLDTDLGAQARLAAVVRTYLERPAGLAADPVAQGRLDALLARLAQQATGPVRQRYVRELSTAIDLAKGRLNGRPVDLGALDALMAAGDEATLKACIDRLPSEELREQARRRVIRLHVRASPYPEVGRAAQAVEEAMVRSGANPVSLEQHPPVRGWLEPGRVPVRHVVVTQDARTQSARLLGAVGGPAFPSVLPEVALRGTLEVELAGLSRPVTLCGGSQDLDVSPCLTAGDLQVPSAIARLDGDGALRLIDAMAEAQAVELVGLRRLVVPLAIAGRQVAILDWPLAFQAPGDLVLEGSRPSERGPDLVVSVEAVQASDRLVYRIAAAGQTYQAVVERSDAPAFHVGSLGGPGRDGADGSAGSDGSAGMDGSSASCPYSSGRDGTRGGDGGRGGDGEDGGPGGGGGDVQVRVAAGPAVRAELLRVLQATITAQGGPGGRGGAGGRGGEGGRGGSGGSGATCTSSDGSSTSLSGGSSGTSGMSGSRGMDGRVGRPGAPGRVTILPGP